MSALWYYSSNGKQMDPVPMSELQRLAANGSLKQSDLVWKDGMASWVKASTVNGLFVASASPSASAIVPAKASAAAPAKSRATLASRDDEDRPRRKQFDDDYDDDDRPRKRRKPRDESGGLGLKIALIGGGSVLALVIVIVIIVVAVGSSRRNAGPAPIAFNNVNNENPIPAVQPGAVEVLNFSANLAERQTESRSVQLKAGHSYEGRLRGDGPSDVDIFIRNPNNQEIASDDTIGPNGYVRFFAPMDGQYTVIVVNVGPGRNRANVVISQLAGAAVAVAPPFNPPGFNPPGFNPPGFNPPQPPIIKPPVFNPPVFNPPGMAGGNRINIGRLGARQRFTVNRDFPAGQMVRIRVESTTIGPADVDLFINRNGQRVVSDTGLSSQCFAPFQSQGGTHEIEVVNLGPGSATCTLIIE
ncbi:MAG: DUF4339 domain-containing protein [Gemmataceae bacterium]|nr:DUF4339 domain-containing protein [Gemmataceae bacterium]